MLTRNNSAGSSADKSEDMRFFSIFEDVTTTRVGAPYFR